MKHVYPIVICCLFVLSINPFLQCSKNPQALTLTLYDKPLLVIQSSLNGKWRLLYKKGGLTGGSYPATNNSYLQLTGSRLLIGNDSSGVVVDTIATWARVAWAVSLNDSTYLLSYNYSAGYGFSYNYFIDGITGDTLRIHDFSADPFYYYYLKC